VIEVRPVTPGDHAAWLALWHAYQRFYAAAIAEETSDLTW